MRLHLTPLIHGVQKEQGTLQERASVLELKCSELQASNRNLTENWEREISSARSAEATFQRRLFEEEKKSIALEAAAKEAQTFLKEREKRAKDLVAELEKSQQEVATMKTVPQPPPSPSKDAVEDSDLVVALRGDCARLQIENEEFVRKFNTIEDRYKSGDLVRSILSRFTRLLTGCA